MRIHYDIKVLKSSLYYLATHIRKGNNNKEQMERIIREKIEKEYDL